MDETSQEPTVTITVTTPKSTHAEIKIAAIRTGETLNDFMLLAAEQRLEKLQAEGVIQ